MELISEHLIETTMDTTQNVALMIIEVDGGMTGLLSARRAISMESTIILHELIRQGFSGLGCLECPMKL